MQKIKEAVNNKVNSLKSWFIEKFWRQKSLLRKLKEKIDKKNKNRGWHDFAQMLMNMATVAAYCTISLAFAEYQKTEWFYIFSIMVILFFGGLSIWDFVCLLGWGKIKNFFKGLRSGIEDLFLWMKEAYPRLRLVLPAMAVLIGFTVYNYHDTKYYRNVAEVFGIPMGVGEPMSAAERQNCAGYWKIQNYPIKSRVELEYQEPYGQMEVMREYSSLYGMRMFQPAFRIVCCYRKGERDKYRSYGQEYFMTAREGLLMKHIMIRKATSSTAQKGTQRWDMYMTVLEMRRRESTLTCRK